LGQLGVPSEKARFQHLSGVPSKATSFGRGFNRFLLFSAFQVAIRAFERSTFLTASFTLLPETFTE